MRVKISYGMHIDDVPKKTAELILDACEKLENIRNKLVNSTESLRNDEDINFSHQVNQVSKSRTNLAEVDEALADVQSILTGLEEYYNGEINDVSERRPIVDPSRDDAT